MPLGSSIYTHHSTDTFPFGGDEMRNALLFRESLTQNTNSYPAVGDANSGQQSVGNISNGTPQWNVPNNPSPALSFIPQYTGCKYMLYNDLNCYLV